MLCQRGQSEEHTAKILVCHNPQHQDESSVGVLFLQGLTESHYPGVVVGPIQKNWRLLAKQFQSSGPAGFDQPFSDLLCVQIIVAPSLQNLKTPQGSDSIHHLVATGKG